MTTLVGIVAEKGKKGVVLASDLRGTSEIWTPVGDIAHRKQTTMDIQKIHVNNDRNVAVSVTGIYDGLYIAFLSRIIEGKIDIRKVIKKEYFPELNELNHRRWDRKRPNDKGNELLIATNFDKQPKLYNCWTLGEVDEVPYYSLGSGAELANEYIQKSGFLIPRVIDLEEAVDLNTESLRVASQDIYTGGLNVVIVGPNRIIEFGNYLKKSEKEKRKKDTDHIKGSLSKL